MSVIQIFTLFLLYSLPLLSDATVVTDNTNLPVIDYEKYKLKNGLEVILVEDHRLPLVSVDTWYHVGAANENTGRTGFAHLFEHMMFAGSKHVPRGMADSLLEASGGDSSNGSTSFDQTNYFETVPSHQLELDLWIHADRMGYLLDVIDETALANQKDVVRNERRENFENRPYGIVEEALWHHLFPKSHPYHAQIIGSHSDIQAASLADIKSFFKLYYRPNNATLVIVGDIDKVKTKKLIEKYFGSLRAGPAIPAITVNPPLIDSEKHVIVKDQVQLPRIIIGWHTPKIFANGDAELSLGGQILGGGKSSRLYRSLVYEQQIAQDVSAYQYSLGLGSIFVIDVTALPGHSATEIKIAIDKELEKFRTLPIDEKELERARNAIETNTIASLEKFGGVAELLNQYNHYTGNPGYFTEEIKRYREITSTEIQQTVNQYLTLSSRVIIEAVPGEKVLAPEISAGQTVATTPGSGAESINANEPWRQQIPKATKAKSLVLPQINTFKLANGLTVVHHYKTGLPIVSAYLAIKSGSNLNPLDKPGLASFTANMMDEGTVNRSTTQIADEIAQLGAGFSIAASLDASTIELFSLKKNFAKAAEIMADIVINPTFKPEEIERQRNSRLADWIQAQTSVPAIATRVAAAALYGPSHPYGYLTLGTDDSIQSITRDDLIHYWQRNWLPNNAAWIVSGDITRDELNILTESLFAKWQPASLPAVRPLKPQTTKAKLVIVDKPDAPQTTLQITTMGTNWKTPDFAALEIANAALGGLFTSRINTTLREEKGYTYGAHSEFYYRKTAGPFEIRTDVRTEVTTAAVQEIFTALHHLKKQPITGAELEKARNSQLLSLPGAFETGSNITHSLANIFIYDLGYDYFERLPKLLRRVDDKAVAAVANKYFRPEKMLVISVGDRKKIEPGLLNLKLKPVEYWNLEKMH